MSRQITHFHSSLVASIALAGGLALLLAGCSADAAAEPTTDGTDTSEATEPEYDGLPDDLASEDICALLEDQAVAQLVGADVTSVTPGSYQPDCTWTYTVPDGPATTLHVQVMSMSQTSNRLGSEALEWARDWAPSDAQIVEIDSLSVPNMSYEFGESVVVYAVDPVGRVFTVAAHTSLTEEDRIAIVESVLAALTETHS